MSIRSKNCIYTLTWIIPQLQYLGITFFSTKASSLDKLNVEGFLEMEIPSENFIHF